MEVYQAIISSINEGNHTFGKILDGTYKICKTTRATFDKNLKEMVMDGILIKEEEDPNHSYYKLNPELTNPSSTLRDLDKAFQYSSEFEKRNTLQLLMLEDLVKIGIKKPEFRNKHVGFIRSLLPVYHNIILDLMKQVSYWIFFTHLIDAKISIKNTIQKRIDSNSKTIGKTFELINRIDPQIRKDLEVMIHTSIIKEAIEAKTKDIAKYGLPKESFDDVMKKYMKFSGRA